MSKLLIVTLILFLVVGAAYVKGYKAIKRAGQCEVKAKMQGCDANIEISKLRKQKEV